MKAFHAYDIRGIYGEEFNSYDVFRIGYFLPSVLNAKKVLIGRDVRTSSPEILESLTGGLTRGGAEVYDAGLSTTPMIYWMTAKYDFDASVMITASHNPKEYNGLKISRREALPVGYDTGLNRLEQHISKPDPLLHISGGKRFDFDRKQEYINFLNSYRGDISSLKTAIDASNGMAGLLINDIFGQEAFVINKKMDGTFPVHSPNPLNLANYKELRKVILDNGCDLGMMFDGDADRVVFTDEQGGFISPDLVIAVLGHYFLGELGLKGNILQDIRSSKSVGEYLRNMGGVMHTWKVGRAFAALKLREIDGIYGGELAGHYYFRDFYYSDSAFLTAILVTRVLAGLNKDGIRFSHLVGRISRYHSSGEVNFVVGNKGEAIEEVVEAMKKAEHPDAVYDFDGYRVEFRDWWFNIRPSNTEPYLRLILEANSKALLNEKLEQIKSIIHQYTV